MELVVLHGTLAQLLGHGEVVERAGNAMGPATKHEIDSITNLFLQVRDLAQQSPPWLRTALEHRLLQPYRSSILSLEHQRAPPLRLPTILNLIRQWSELLRGVLRLLLDPSLPCSPLSTLRQHLRSCGSPRLQHLLRALLFRDAHSRLFQHLVAWCGFGVLPAANDFVVQQQRAPSGDPARDWAETMAPRADHYLDAPLIARILFCGQAVGVLKHDPLEQDPWLDPTRFSSALQQLLERSEHLHDAAIHAELQRVVQEHHEQVSRQLFARIDTQVTPLLQDLREVFFMARGEVFDALLLQLEKVRPTPRPVHERVFQPLLVQHALEDCSWAAQTRVLLHPQRVQLPDPTLSLQFSGGAHLRPNHHIRLNNGSAAVTLPYRFVVPFVVTLQFQWYPSAVTCSSPAMFQLHVGSDCVLSFILHHDDDHDDRKETVSFKWRGQQVIAPVDSVQIVIRPEIWHTLQIKWEGTALRFQLDGREAGHWTDERIISSALRSLPPRVYLGIGWEHPNEQEARVDISSLSIAPLVHDHPSNNNTASPEWLTQLTVSFQVKWPLALVVGARQLQQYEDVFHLLLKCKRAVLRLARVRPRLHSAALLKARMLFWLQNLLFYLQVEVLEVQWAKLKAGRPCDLETLRSAHQQYLEAITQQCLLHSRVLLRAVDHVLEACAALVDLVDPSEEQVAALQQRFDREAAFLATVLSKKPQMAQLLLRLDFNQDDRNGNGTALLSR